MRLKPDIHIALSGSDLVVLDLARDAYLIAPGAAGPLSHPPTTATVIRDPQVAALLAEGGFVQTEADRPGLERAPAHLPVPARRSLGEGPAELRLGDVAAFAAALGGLIARGSGPSLLARVNRARRLKRGACLDTPPDAETARRVRAFFRLLVWTPQGECVFRSDLLLRYLRVRGGDARWVFGVQTWPFRAHCWLQAGDVSLTDDVETLLALSPILQV